jgi:hypothetical protein
MATQSSGSPPAPRSRARRGRQPHAAGSRGVSVLAEAPAAGVRAVIAKPYRVGDLRALVAALGAPVSTS